MRARSGRTLLVALAVSLTALACGPTAIPAPAPTDDEGLPFQPIATPVAAAPAAVPAPQVGGTNRLPGRLLFIKDGNLWDYQNGAAHEVAVGNTFRQPRWSPDGSRFAYVYRGTNFSDIFVGVADGSSHTRLTSSQARIIEDNDWNFRPTWSPDGRQIAYVTDTASVNPTLWVMNAADGSGRRAVRSADFVQEAVDELSWSPDGAWLAMTLFSGPGPSQVALVSMAAGQRVSGRVLTQHANGALDPAWSPDGAWLAYVGREGRAVNLYVARPDGTGTQKLTASGVVRAPAWSPDGKHLAFLSAQTGAFEVWVIDVAAEEAGTLKVSAPRQVTRELSLDAISGVTWGP